jgi:hypothetical protein
MVFGIIQAIFKHKESNFSVLSHLRLISVSLSDRTRKIQFELFPIINDKVHSCLDIQYFFEVYSVNGILFNFSWNKGLVHNFSTTEHTESTERCRLSLCPLCTLWFFTFQKIINSLVSGLTKSPQSTQRAQSLNIPVDAYEKAAASRFRTRMTRIARIFTDTRAPSSAQSVFSRIYSLIDEDTIVMWRPII